MHHSCGKHLLFALLCGLIAPGVARGQETTTADTAPADSLDGARSLLKAGNFDGAAFSAIEVLERKPGDGAALFILGMARFRATRYEEALRAFAAARTSPNPPTSGSLLYNEAATLYALERFAEAEQAFVAAAAAAPDLATLALINAGQAAVDTQNVTQARAHLARAQQAGDSASFAVELQELKEDIEEEAALQLQDRIDDALDDGHRASKAGKTREAIALYESALAVANAGNASAADRAELEFALGSLHYKQRDYEEALPHLEQATTLSAQDPDFHYQAAMANYRLDRADEARLHFDQALALKLDPETARLAETYRAALGWGLTAQSTGLAMRAQVGSGYDSNVLLLGALRSDVVNAEYDSQDSFFVATGVEALYTKVWRDAFALQGGYMFDQIAYSNPDADVFSMQIHNASLAGETVMGSFHGGLGASGEYQISGIETFEPFLAVLSLAPSLGLDEGDFTSTWLDVRVSRKIAQDPAFDVYAGKRRDIRLTQRFRYRGTRANVSLRSRREDIGTNELDLMLARETLQGIYTVPYSYRSTAALAGGSVTVWDNLRLSVDLSFEKVAYQGDNVLRIEGAFNRFTEMRVRRKDDRFAASVGMTYPFGDYVNLGLRYDYVHNDSTMAFKVDDKNFTKHTVGLELSIDY